MGYCAVFLFLGISEWPVPGGTFCYEGSTAWRTFVFETLKARITPAADTRWHVFSQQFTVSQPLVMPSTWLGGRDEDNTFVLITDDNVLSGVRLLT